MEMKTVYFESGGRHNTEATLKLVKERALASGIRDVVIASVTGFSAGKALEILSGTPIRMTIVNLDGFQGRNFFPTSLKERLREKGHNACSALDVKYEFPKEMQTALCRFCEGMKVCVEIMLIATEAGLIQPGEEIITAGGTGM
ncbi:MAG: hypothetical protein NZ952_06855, partial [Candidatus Bathyarchaeota archaeon]|nr:hypothetical protein [Candidatus Bathyarchaeota archaeon]